MLQRPRVAERRISRLSPHAAGVIVSACLVANQNRASQRDVLDISSGLKTRVLADSVQRMSCELLYVTNIRERRLYSARRSYRFD
jgi:hypothetical protein